MGKGIDYLTAYIGLAAAAGAKLVPPSSVYEGLRPIVRPVCEPELRPMDSGITHVSYYAQESGDGPVVAVATYIDDYGPEPIRSYTAADAPDLATARGLPVHLTRWPRDSRYPSFTSIRTAAEEPITNAVGTIIASATIMCMPLEARPLNNAG